MRRSIVRLIAMGLAVIATASVTTACMMWFHRPEVPAELLKK